MNGNVRLNKRRDNHPGPPMSVPGRRPIRAVPDQPRAEVGAFRARHLALAEREIVSEFGKARVTVDDSESPLAWLARRRGRDGRALIEPHQLQAGERLRADFTLAHLMPRTTASWSSPIVIRPRVAASAPRAPPTTMVGGAPARAWRARCRSGRNSPACLLDVCCFLKGIVGRRARARLAGALGQGRAAARARPSCPRITATPRRRAAQSATQGARLCARGWRRMRRLGWRVCDGVNDQGLLVRKVTSHLSWPV